MSTPDTKALTGANSKSVLAVGPSGSLWVATLPNGLNPTVTDNWVWTQLPPIPAT